MREVRGLERAIKALSRPGGVVLYPTNTLYGIGGRVVDLASVRRVLSLKHRVSGGLIVLAERPPLQTPSARALALAFWPGPLSLVVQGWPGLPAEVLGDDGTVAVRPPQHAVAAELVRAMGPLTSTSANRPGQPPALEPGDCPLAVDAVVDVGVLAPAMPSTLVDPHSGKVLREGAVPVHAIAAVLAGVDRREGR